MTRPPDPPDLDATLRERFGLDSFRPWQREAIEAAVAPGARVLVVAPTGGGKSLTYQLPAVALPGTTLVICPLVALMEDQVRALDARGIPATYIASTIDPDARRVRESSMVQGKYKIVYVAPERLAFEPFVDKLARMNIPLVAVDEAHCIAQWGHDFRPDYLRIGELIERLDPPRVLACTATATPEVRREIRERLGFVEGASREVLRGFARPNLHLAAMSVSGPSEARERMDDALREALGSKARPKGGAIVYAATRKQTELYAEHLRKSGWNAAGYHAGMEPTVRATVATRFAARELDVVVATNAFGMGIDRADIRCVVHVQPPASIEAYYQEVGRAGRDGAEASGLLLCSGMDIALRRRLSELASDGGPAAPEVRERAWGLFRDLLRYLDACTCRHDFVLRYFGDDRETLGGCGHCDVCADLDGADDAGDQLLADGEDAVRVRKALAGVARAKQRAGLIAVTEMLCGMKSERTTRFGFTHLSTFGVLQERPLPWVTALMRGLLAAGWVDLTTSEHPVPFITNAGWDVMKGQGAVRFRVPREMRAVKRKKGARETEVPRMPKRESPAFAVEGAAEPVFERLRAYRARIAKARGVPPYVIALDRTLAELAAKRPARIQDLSNVYGLGPARIESYGDGLLAAIRG